MSESITTKTLASKTLATKTLAAKSHATKEALKNRATSNGYLMLQWLSAGWGGEMAFVQSFPKDL